jgi:DinB superfamily
MPFRLGEAVELLEQTPAVMDALLRGRSSAWLECRLEAGAFSPIDVLGHLIFGEMTDWIPRARIILEHQKSRAFDPFDRRGFGPLIEGKDITELLQAFAELRTQSLAALRSFDLNEEKLDLAGVHPEFGEVTLRELLATWVVHDLGHIAQITRIMANQYRDDVGPWRAYTSILQG